MFDIAPSEFLLVAIVALVVIGPKDLPRVMRLVGEWVGRARAMTRHFRAGVDTMMREVELDEIQRRWAIENERIMREHPSSELIPTASEAEPAKPEGEAAATPRPLPSARPPGEAVEVEPSPDHGPRLRRGSEIDSGSGL